MEVRVGKQALWSLHLLGLEKRQKALRSPLRQRSHCQKLTILLLFFASGLCGCRSLKNVNTETVENQQNIKLQEQQKLSVDELSHTDQHFFEWKLDSLNNNTTVMIWPKGKFTFSSEKGFEGEAEKVLLNSSLQKSAAMLKQKDSVVNHQRKVLKEQKLKQKIQVKNKQSLKKETPAFWPIIGLAVLVIAGIIMYKLLKP